MKDQRPILQAILVADHCYQDIVTGKCIVAGIFGKIIHQKNEKDSSPESQSPQGPQTVRIPRGGFKSGSPFAYVNMTEIHGKQDFSLRYVALESDQVLFNANFQGEAQSPLDPIERIIPLPVLPTKPGVYALELIWNNELLGAHRIEAVIKEAADE